MKHADSLMQLAALDARFGSMDTCQNKIYYKKSLSDKQMGQGDMAKETNMNICDLRDQTTKSMLNVYESCPNETHSGILWVKR
jgi:hypothetical protein